MVITWCFSVVCVDFLRSPARALAVALGGADAFGLRGARRRVRNCAIAVEVSDAGSGIVSAWGLLSKERKEACAQLSRDGELLGGRNYVGNWKEVLVPRCVAPLIC